MNLTLQIDGREMQFEVRQDGDNREFRLGDGPVRQAQLLEIAPGVFSVLLDGHSYEARVGNGPDGIFVTVGGRRLHVQIDDPRRGGRRASGRRTDGPLQVSASMPGKIVRLLVALGDQVVAGQGLIVVEAMKMQNEMKAARPGRVSSIPVREGDTVTAGAVLAVIE
jgi:biotin carboxyl carrier protein